MDKTNCNAILATRYLILVTWYALPDICYLLLDTCNLIQLPWYLVPNICCKIILTWYLLFVPLNLLTEAKYLILIFVNWNFLHVTYLCDTYQWIPDQWYFRQNARFPHTCSKYLRRESIYYNGWPTKKYTMFNTQKKHIYLSFICTKSPISRLHIAKDIQHIGTIYLVFHV